jgi:AcrR family transcriptional regulator
MANTTEMSTSLKQLGPLTPERRRQLTRSHLLAAAEGVFIEKGFHAASVDAVASAAGFTKGAVYANFKDKEDLFIALTEERWARHMDAVQTALQDATALESATRADLFTHMTADLLWLDREWQLLFLEFSVYAARNLRAQQRLAEREAANCAAVAAVLTAQFGQAGIKPPLPVHELAAIIVAFFNGIALRHATHPDPGDESLLNGAIRLLDMSLSQLQ